jgi:hypothetical protein
MIRQKSCYNVALGGIGGAGKMQKSNEWKQRQSECMKGNKHCLGKSWLLSDDTKRKMRKPKADEHRLKLSGKNNPMFGKFGSNNPNFGSHRSADTKRKQSVARKLWWALRREKS